MELYYDERSPPCYAVLMILNQVGAKYNSKHLDIVDKLEHTKDEFLRINPLGKVPALKDGNFCLGESRAIGIYICDTYESKDKLRKLYPTDPKERALVNRALWVDSNNWSKIYGFVYLRKMFLEGVGLDDSKKAAFFEGLDSYELLLSQSEFLALPYPTIADIFAISTLKLIDYTRFKAWDKYPKLAKWKKTMEQQPYYEESMGKFVTKYANLLLSSDRYLDCTKD